MVGEINKHASNPRKAFGHSNSDLMEKPKTQYRSAYSICISARKRHDIADDLSKTICKAYQDQQNSTAHKKESQIENSYT